MTAHYNYLTGNLAFDADDCSIYEDADKLLIYDGDLRPSYMQKLIEAETQKEYQEAFIGPFYLLSYHKKERTLTVFQQFSGCGSNVYFLEKDQDIYIATSIKELKHISGSKCYLNTDMIPLFIVDSFFPDGQTLLKNVTRLKSGVILTIDVNGVHEEKLLFSDLSEDSRLSPEEEYRAAVSHSIADNIHDLQAPLHLPLSGGYDSNCILFHLRKQLPDASLYTYCVGGISGTDESAVAAEIAGNYDNVYMQKALVSPETLTHIDEIAEALEGSVFERGLFLQFELARLLKSKNAPYVICGEGADQVFREDTFTYRERPQSHYAIYSTPYEALTSIILPKSRLMLNHFGVKGRYPFMHPEVLKLAYRTRALNGRYKAFHKAALKNILPEAIYALISKKGGSTDLSPLFEAGFNCSLEMKKLKFYSPKLDPELVYQDVEFPADMNNMDEAVRKYYLQLRFLESFEKQFCDK